MNNLWPVVGTIVAAALGLFGTWLVQRNARRQNASTDSQQLIDQLQENYAADRTQWIAERTSLAERQSRTEKRLEQGEAMLRLALDYILNLRWHIAEGEPPPPPPFPAELLRPFEDGRDRN